MTVAQPAAAAGRSPSRSGRPGCASVGCPAAAVAGHGRWDGVLPEVRLLAEWPDGEDEPTRFWLSGLLDDTPIPELVRLAKIRWRIEHDAPPGGFYRR